ncbi:hypothetical protein [Pseudonocardia sp. TRM90224]|uniref:hypothetical protein n=1 Tax=Pseudonocardia sp. TRM90224 TaxID=2812678 RepID=UPI001E62F3D5|nr:hypothetical protein [Pseudonocardia sp. TRM90224]
MADLLAFVVLVATFAAVLGGLAALAIRVRRRGLSGGYSLMGVFDELWRPGVAAARMDLVVQEERQAPSPAPGDRLLDSLTSSLNGVDAPGRSVESDGPTQQQAIRGYQQPQETSFT